VKGSQEKGDPDEGKQDGLELVKLKVAINGIEVLGFFMAGVPLLEVGEEEELDMTYCYEMSYLSKIGGEYKDQNLSNTELDFKLSSEHNDSAFEKHISAPDIKYRIEETQQDGFTHRKVVFE